MFLEDRVSAGSAEAPLPRTMNVALPAGDDADMVALLGELLGWRAVAADAARIHLRAERDVVRVETGDPSLARRLACNGLDQLVRPLNLAALEQLMVVAG